jgi:transcriptional regulator with XRE-family HTH domain
MIDLGKRLKEERERLGLTQAKFSEACGVGRTAQFNYERGEREPSWSYISAAEKIGVDVLYVFTGIHAGKDFAMANAYSRLVYTIEMFLGLQEGNLEELAKEAVSLQGKEVQMMEQPGTVGVIYYGDWQDKVIAWLGTSRKPERCIDAALLAGLLDSVDLASAKLGVSLSTEKRVRAALMLYRDAKPQKGTRHPGLHDFGGNIQQDDIDKAVKLAAG